MGHWSFSSSSFLLLLHGITAFTLTAPSFTRHYIFLIVITQYIILETHVEFSEVKLVTL